MVSVIYILFCDIINYGCYKFKLSVHPAIEFVSISILSFPLPSLSISLFVRNTKVSFIGNSIFRKDLRFQKDVNSKVIEQYGDLINLGMNETNC